MNRPSAPKMRLDTHRPVSIDEIERRLREGSPNGKPRHYRIGPPPLVEDVTDIIAEIRASWSTHLLVGLLGFAVGCFGTVGLAHLIAGVPL